MSQVSNLLSSRRSRLGLILCAALVVCAILLLIFLRHRQSAGSPLLTSSNALPSTQSQGTVTGQQSPATGGFHTDSLLPSEYTASDNAYSIAYPQDWENTTSADESAADVSTFTYQANGIAYTFRVSRPGQLNPEGISNLSTDRQTIQYNGANYIRIVWSSNGAPFYVTAVPKNPAGANYFDFSMQIPAADSGLYVGTFDRVVASFTTT